MSIGALPKIKFFNKYNQMYRRYLRPAPSAIWIMIGYGRIVDGPVGYIRCPYSPCHILAALRR